MDNTKYKIQEITFEEMHKQFNNASPLQLSRKMLEVELYEQQSSMKVLQNIYDDFETKENLIDELVTPLLLNIADGMVKHPKLKDVFQKTNITASRLVNEVNSFSYESDNISYIDANQFQVQAQKTYYNSKLRGKFYDKKNRSDTERDKEITRVNGSAQVTDDVTGNALELSKNDANGDPTKMANMDHVTSLKHLQEKFQKNPYIHRSDISKLAGLPENESYINERTNKQKGEMSYREFREKHPDALTKEQWAKAIELEEKSEKAIKNESRKMMAKNVGMQGLGEALMLLLKPIWFEIKDIVKNGITYGFDTTDKIEAFIRRIKRAYKFIQKEVLPTLGSLVKDVLSNFAGMLMNYIVDMFMSVVKNIVKIITDGFLAIKEAIKILLKPNSEMSQAQKADAITKLVATAVVPILMFNFETALSKIPVIGDVATIMMTGVITSLVVWLLNEIDIFSVKDEKRMMRIREIFELRVNTIKDNTDAFQTESIETLAKQRLAFKKIVTDMGNAIENNRNLNSSVYELANFMKIDLKVKSTDDFMEMLTSKAELTI